ncbi:MAG: response regulator [Chloroflexi bacterium]|nr:response regulator [Chloroflexota bacterium]
MVNVNTLEALVVEDEKDSAEVVGRILQFQNISHHIANTVPDAITILEEENPTVAIIDLMLPDIDGWELLSMIRRTTDYKDMVCVAITAFHSSAVERKALEHGFDGYFPKPLNATSFVRELLRIVEEHPHR